MTPFSARLSAGWLAAGIALTTATQLRLPDLPVGAGELLLAAWLFGTVATYPRGGGIVIGRAARVFLAFWFCGFVLMILGWQRALHQFVDVRGEFHDFLAYTFVAALTLVLTLRRDAQDQVRRTVQIVLFLAVGGLCAIWGLTLLGIVPREFSFYSGVRFRGWSNNPNQVALVMTAAPFFALHGLVSSAAGRARLAYGLLFAASVVLGLATESDGMLTAWVGGATVLVIWGWIRDLRQHRLRRFRAFFTFVLYPSVIVLLLVLLGSSIYRNALALGQEVFDESQQGEVRITLWMSGLDAIRRSPLVGWGPGTHASLDGSDLHVAEAHNAVIDWGTVTGIPGMCVLLALNAWMVWRGRKDPCLFGGLAALLALGLTHHDLRHPIYWLFLLYVVMAPRAAHEVAPETRRAAPVRRGRPGIDATPALR